MVITISSQPSADEAANGNSTFELTTPRDEGTELSFTGIDDDGSNMVISVSGNTTILEGDSVLVDFDGWGSYVDGYYEVISPTTSTAITINYAYTGGGEGAPTGTSPIITQSNTGVKIAAYIYKLSNEFLSDIAPTATSGGDIWFEPKSGDPLLFTSDKVVSYEHTTAGNNTVNDIDSVTATYVKTTDTFISEETGYISHFNSANEDLKLIIQDYDGDGTFSVELGDIATDLGNNFYNLPAYTKSTGVYTDIAGEDTLSYIIRFREVIDEYSYSSGVRTKTGTVEQNGTYSTPVRVHNIYLEGTETISDFKMSTSNKVDFLDVLSRSQIANIYPDEKIMLSFFTDEYQVKFSYNFIISSAIDVERKRGYVVIDYSDFSADIDNLFVLNSSDVKISSTYDILYKTRKPKNALSLQFANRKGGIDVYTFEMEQELSEVSKVVFRDNNKDYTAYAPITDRTASLKARVESAEVLEGLKDLYRTDTVYYIDGTTQVKTYVKTSSFVEKSNELFVPAIEVKLKNESEKYG